MQCFLKNEDNSLIDVEQIRYVFCTQIEICVVAVQRSLHNVRSHHVMCLCFQYSGLFAYVCYPTNLGLYKIPKVH